MSSGEYALTNDATARATAAGLVDADWYMSPVHPTALRTLTQRTDRRAAIDAALWLALVAAAGAATVTTYGSWWVILTLSVFGTLYGGAADARWHEYGHGTAFASRRANQALYYLASFMLLREPTISRWTHFRHHSDTIIVGRDPEIILRRPPRLGVWMLNLVNLVNGPRTLVTLLIHSTGRMTSTERSYVPVSERRKVAGEARVFLAVLAAVVAGCVLAGSILPALLIGLPTFYGAWLVQAFNVTQHAGLPENITDHRRVARTFLMNPIGRFLYLNMNYHIEHHMYPSVPYHQLPGLHHEITADLPTPNPSLIAAYREILPALLRQRHDPNYEIVRPIPNRGAATRVEAQRSTDDSPQEEREGWIRVARLDEIDIGTVARFDHGDQTYAIYRLGETDWRATDGICTHSRSVHLATGTVIGNRIECPKHNGQFDIDTGEPVKEPVCIALNTYQVEHRSSGLYLRRPEANCASISGPATAHDGAPAPT